MTTGPTAISASTAVFKSEAVPTCDPNVALALQPNDCQAFNLGAVYNFGFTGITRWSCLDVKQCGAPFQIFAVPPTGPIPEIFKNTAVWENLDIKPNGLSLDTAPTEVTIALRASQWEKCLQWNKGMIIPLSAFDDLTGTYKPLKNLPYMCGQSKAYLIKNSQTAAQISVDDFLKLTAAEQEKNGAYKTATSTGTISADNMKNPISVDKYNPNEGRYSAGYIKGVQYAYGVTVNQANRVFVCNSNACNTDPVLDRTGKIWTFKNTESPPPSRKVLIDPNYSYDKEYFFGYFAKQNGAWYTCIAQDKKKKLSTVGDTSFKVYNPCNILEDLNLGAAVNSKEWSLVGLDNDCDFTQPVVASPWNAEVDWQVGDYYADTTAKKVFQCTGGANKDASLCRTKFALNTDQWKDVTTVTLANGTVQSNYDEGFSANKPGPRFRAKWYQNVVYFKGDVIEVAGKDRTEYFICKGDLCATTNPLDWYSTDNAAVTVAKAQWGKFNAGFGGQNPDFAQYDINVNNAQTIPELSYAGFSEAVKCDFRIPTDATAFTITATQLTFCDGADGTIVRICNSSLANKCAGYTKAQLQALPRSRALGHFTTVEQTTDHYKYVSAALYAKDDVVLATNAAGQNVYYKVGPFNAFSANKISPFTPGQDVWLKQGQLIAKTGVDPKDPLVPTATDCIPIETIPFFLDTKDFLQTLPDTYSIYKADDHMIKENSYVCDANAVYKCIDTGADEENLCTQFGPDTLDFIWTYEPTRSPKPFPKLTSDSIIFGKVYNDWIQNPPSFNDVVFKDATVTVNNVQTTVLKAYRCSTNPFQTYQCSQKVPGAEGSALIWVEENIDGKILVDQQAAKDYTVTKAKHTPAVPNGAAASDTFEGLTKIGSNLQAYPQFRYSDIAPKKDTTYKDLKFVEGDTVAVDNGFVFMCFDNGAGTCKNFDPVSPDQAVWQLQDDVVASVFSEIPIIQVLDGYQWQAGYPYVQGDVVCNVSGDANIVKNGFYASTIDANGGNERFWDYYDPLHPFYYRCKVVAAPVPAEVAAEEFSALARFDNTSGDYSAIAAGTNVFFQGRVFECIIATQCNVVQPNQDSSTWKLTNKKGTLKPPTTAFNLSALTPPPIPDCLLDDFKSFSTTPGTEQAPNANNWSLSANPLLNVQGRQMCSSDPQLKRKLFAGQPEYKSIGPSKAGNLPYNMVIYRQSVDPNLIALATLGKDFIIKKHHIETAFASFPLFCGDAPAGQDPFENCRKDLAGFAIFIKMFNLAESFNTDSGVSYSQTGFDVIIDKKCWSIVNSKDNGFDITSIYGEFAVQESQACTQWKSYTSADPLGVFPEYRDAYYFSRGTSPFPLIGAADYGLFSQVLLTNKTFLLKNPSYAEDPRMVTLVAMWRYMSYDVNKSTGPSIHDIFTGHWTPNPAETAAGLKVNEPVNSALAVVLDARLDNDGTQTCADYFNAIPISEVARQVYASLGFPVEVQNQNLFCTGYLAYPRALGPNAGLWLKYDTTTSNCQLSTTRTRYHAFRYGDVKACMADAEAKQDYVQARKDVASTKKWFTDWMINEPYVTGSLAGFMGTLTTPLTDTRCRYCLDQKLCASTQPAAAATPVWGVCDGVEANKSPAPANTMYYDKDLHVKPEIVDCVQWDQIRSGKLDIDFIEIVRPGTPFYVCYNNRVFSCITTKAACFAVADPMQDAVNFQLYDVRGKDAQESLPQLYCTDNDRYGSEQMQPEVWSYDFSNLEFKNYGQVCSYDRNFLVQISKGFQYRFLTASGLTSQQLAKAGEVCGADGAQLCTDEYTNQKNFAEYGTGSKSKQEIWDLVDTAIDSMADVDKKEGLKTVGIIPANPVVKTFGKPTWQYQDRTATDNDVLYVNKGWMTLPTKKM